MIRLISAQPAEDYYAWQVEVFLDRTIELGYNGNHIDVLGAFIDNVPDSWIKLQKKYPFVRFFFYQNTLGNCNYAPAVQPHILAKHFDKHPYLQDEAIFFHDCDFLFTRFFDFSPYLNDDNWYFSNTDSYIGADYLESKGSRVNEKGEEISILDDMAKVIGICACKIRSNRGRAGGAQKLMKNVTSEYWRNVEEDSINLYNWLLTYKDMYTEGVNDIQVWTASMWAELWNALKIGINVMTPKDFDFAWATCHISKWYEHPFFHNAGVLNDKQGMFYKASYRDKFPYNDTLEVDHHRCSIMYWEAIKKTAKNSVLIP